MADYNDYLDYLHHVDDTTAQEFKKKEDELRHQIDVVRDQCQRDIRNIQERVASEKAHSEADHKSAIDTLTSQYEASVEKLKTEKKQIESAHKAELKRINTEKENTITQLINEKNAALAKVEEEKEIPEKFKKNDKQKWKNYEKKNILQKKTKRKNNK